MLRIRFFRVGKKNQPSFKIIVTDKRRPVGGGRFVETVGFYNPLTKEKVLRKERIKYWLSVGAKPSATVYNLIISEKVLDGKKIPLHKQTKEVKEKPGGIEEIKEKKEEKLVEEKLTEGKMEEKKDEPTKEQNLSP